MLPPVVQALVLSGCALSELPCSGFILVEHEPGQYPGRPTTDKHVHYWGTEAPPSTTGDLWTRKDKP